MLAFHVIGMHLVWKVGNITEIYMGVYGIMGCDNRILLSIGLVYYLQEIIKLTLNYVLNPHSTFISMQG